MEVDPDQIDVESAAGLGVQYRIWLVNRRRGWDGPWDTVPPGALAVAPIFPGAFSLPAALAFLHCFNTDLERHVDTSWAVRVPVRILYDGDLISGHFVERQPR